MSTVFTLGVNVAVVIILDGYEAKEGSFQTVSSKV
jgi:hypothetical protein